LPTESEDSQAVRADGNKNRKKGVRDYFFVGSRRLRYPSSPRKHLLHLYKNLLQTLLSLLPKRTTDNRIINDYPDLPNVIYGDECRAIFLGLVHAFTLMNLVHRVWEKNRGYVSTHEDVSASLQLMQPLIEMCKSSIEDAWDGYILGIVKEMMEGEFTGRELWLETGIDRKKIRRSLHRLHESGHLRRSGNRYRGYRYILNVV